MNKTEANNFEKLFHGHLPVMPVITLNQVKLVKPLIDTLLANDIRLIEITLRTPNALEVIEAISKASSDIILGAGTLTHTEQFQQARNAGAHFAVSPGLTPELAIAAQTAHLPFMPGVATASEIILAMQFDHRFLKFFPAELSGGKDFVNSMRGPFTEIKFCPTGGINIKNCRDYLNLGNVFCLGATWLAPQNLIEEQQWQKISERIETMKTTLGLSAEHKI